MIYKPTITNRPRIISNDLMRLLKKTGSIREVKKAPVLMVTNATDTFETFIAEKNAIQWSAIRIPLIKNLTNAWGVIFKGFFTIRK